MGRVLEGNPLFYSGILYWKIQFGLLGSDSSSPQMCLENVKQTHRWVDNVINTALTPSFTCSYHLYDEDHKVNKVELPLSPWRSIFVPWNYIHSDFYLCGNHTPHSPLPTNQLYNLRATALSLPFYMPKFFLLLSTFVPSQYSTQICFSYQWSKYTV